MSERDVRVAYEHVATARSQLESLTKLREASKRNYDSQRRDYELGIVSNLEVLQAIRQLQDAELRLARAESLVETKRLELDVAAGGPAA